ncbi:unannotated protein [freshwater metagenome]|uniref:Unannotated protein n=1 Tax=freshwater metagenome TaxID=449393 RepID=A0A6J7AG70_9ZZZZ
MDDSEHSVRWLGPGNLFRGRHTDCYALPWPCRNRDRVLQHQRHARMWPPDGGDRNRGPRNADGLNHGFDCFGDRECCLACCIETVRISLTGDR